MKKILILGSTGSIGQSTIDIVRTFPKEFEIVGLSANQNTEDLLKQIKEFKIKTVAINDEAKAKELKSILNSKCEILIGEKGIIELVRRNNYDILVTALVGFAGLIPTIEAIKLKKRIALANKETLVVAGEIIINLAKEYGAEIIPVDSEHSAIFQCLVGENKNYISKIILTASGGPFLNKSINELYDVTIQEALNHPNWKMGNKITIDSATMMNKGLEVIEAFWLFQLPKHKIEVVIHPQSVIHSMVEFVDGSIKAQLSSPNMKLPILYALTFPERFQYSQVLTDFKKISNLSFFEPDFDKFVCLKIAYDVISEGGVSSCILNAANEVAVDSFLKGKIKFTQIPDYIKFALDKIDNKFNFEINDIIETDKKTRELLNSIIN
ncbi:1-deoxy-D-xylulose-5-phosphate reductoisomerase [Stygiobacter electus]|uniref:1-deoxy-D-xylulose 5-phosphate reductoisomerase n=1 Tax=Stygiobacter electus TaxID=3032292 RepID=A0AAE3P099_9BACT|nr:1-deoxy-D-xylulose-5-phosphate reductoisomerase [Stygiobacter electus]MDF1611944.1 1-deoxy-D-xylulose-5-phosphate reductoisomerase [Stygiobacter electus]